MTGAEFALIVGVFLVIAAFTALIVVLVKVLDAMRLLRQEIEAWRDETEPLLESLRTSADDARYVMEEARHDLYRFDRVLGSAEAISGAMEGTSRITRVALSTPVIKIAALATGTSRAAHRLRNQDASQPLVRESRRQRRRREKRMR